MITAVYAPNEKLRFFFSFAKLRGKVGELQLVTGLKRDPAWPDKSRVTRRLCLSVWQERFHTSSGTELGADPETHDIPPNFPSWVLGEIIPLQRFLEGKKWKYGSDQF